MSTPNLRYPTDQVVGIIPSPADLTATVAALRDADIPDERIHVLRSNDDHGDVAPDAHDADGAIASLVQVVQKALGDEVARLEQLEEALDAGHDVVSVELTEGSDAARDQDKARIADALHRHGARDVAFYGSFQIQQLDAGGTT